MRMMFRRCMSNPDSTIRRGYTRAKSFSLDLQKSIAWANAGEMLEDGCAESQSWRSNSFYTYYQEYNWRKYDFLNVDPDELPDWV